MFGRNPYCGGGYMDEMRLGLIMTWVPMYYNSEFQYKTRSPFFQSAWKRRMYPHVAAWASRRSIRAPRSHSPLWVLFIKLVLRITSPPLNRFPRFQLRWVPLGNTFPTTYHTSRYAQGMPRKSM